LVPFLSGKNASKTPDKRRLRYPIKQKIVTEGKTGSKDFSLSPDHPKD
jgi:hypothetical protein